MGGILPGVQGPATNPIFRNFPLPDPSAGAPETPWEERGNFAGATNKAGALILLCVAIATWVRITGRTFLSEGARSHELLLLAFTLLSAAAAALVFLTLRKKARAPLTAPLYAVVQGLLLGVVAAGSGTQYPGVAIQAVLATAAMSLALLLGYRSRLIRVTDNFNRKITSAIGGAVLFYAVNFVLGRMGKPAFSLWAGGVPGIVVLAVIAYLAGVCMTADFDSAVHNTNANFPQSVEWYVALGLVLSLVWFLLDAIDVFGFWEASPQGPPGAGPPMPPP